MIGEMNLKPEEVFLAQGTLRPDLIESASHLASGKADVIKTHHNDTELIRKLRDEVQHVILTRHTAWAELVRPFMNTCFHSFLLL